MLPVYIIDCTGIKSADELWRRYLSAVPAENPEAFGYTLDSFWDAVQWQGPGWPGECELVFQNVDALAKLKTRGGQPFLEAFIRLANETDRITIRLS
ncbi:barstar family protein [Brucella intermedia]|uniref:barstar family protein n=1 Tax=Brucella intermedia TaxID=94625 RepID=UPI00124E88ED|nr:barstar family protein [Brucella intermedia]KAB2711806.1 barstar family protein [Brucella intermedia]